MRVAASLYRFIAGPRPSVAHSYSLPTNDLPEAAANLIHGNTHNLHSTGKFPPQRNEKGGSIK